MSLYLRDGVIRGSDSPPSVVRADSNTLVFELGSEEVLALVQELTKHGTRRTYLIIEADEITHPRSLAGHE